MKTILIGIAVIVGAGILLWILEPLVYKVRRAVDTAVNGPPPEMRIPVIPVSGRAPSVTA